MHNSVLFFRSPRYTIAADNSGGFLLTRLADRYTVYLQPGDDSVSLRAALQDLREDDPHGVMAFTHSLMEYDAVMTPSDTANGATQDTASVFDHKEGDVPVILWTTEGKIFWDTVLHCVVENEVSPR